MGLVIRTWNLYHGRTHPKSGRTYLERMVRLASIDAPDVVALQEVPLWALGRMLAVLRFLEVRRYIDADEDEQPVRFRRRTSRLPTTVLGARA